MKKLSLLQKRILFTMTLLVFQEATLAHAETAVSAPNSMKWVVEGAKGDYSDIGGREWRNGHKKELAEQVKKAAAELAAAEAELEQLKAKRTEIYKAANFSDLSESAELAQIDEEITACLDKIQALKLNHEKALAEQKAFWEELSNEPIYASFGSGVKYYGWKDKQGNKGSQFLVPINTWMGNGKYSLGIYGNYAFSKDRTKHYEGSEHSLTDITIDLKRKIELNVREEMEYTLGLKLPTGKNALDNSGRNSRMSDDLVEVDEYGKSWELVPGVSYSWRPFKFDKLTVGTNFVFSGYYDPTSDLPNDKVKSGREWRKFVKYQHAEEKWQFVGEIQTTDYNRTFSKQGWSYDRKDEWLVRLTYNRKIAKDQELTFYYWPEYKSLGESGGNQPLDAENSWAHLYGTRWRRFIDEKNTIRLSFDVLNTNGRRYAGVRSYYDWGYPSSHYNEVDGRDKYTVGIGYDHTYKNNKAVLSIDVKYFWMHDGKSTFGEPATRYKGFNVFVMYNRNATFHW